MSTEQKLGRLIGLVESQHERLERIESKLDTKVSYREFENAWKEHDPMNKRIDALEAHRDRGALWRKIGERALYVTVGAIVVAGLAAVGLA